MFNEMAETITAVNISQLLRRSNSYVMSCDEWNNTVNLPAGRIDAVALFYVQHVSGGGGGGA